MLLFEPLRPVLFSNFIWWTLILFMFMHTYFQFQVLYSISTRPQSRSDTCTHHFAEGKKLSWSDFTFSVIINNQNNESKSVTTFIKCCKPVYVDKWSHETSEPLVDHLSLSLSQTAQFVFYFFVPIPKCWKCNTCRAHKCTECTMLAVSSAA